MDSALTSNDNRTRYSINHFACMSCKTCIEQCRHGAVIETIHGFDITDDCIGCGICAAACPIKCIHPID